MEDKRIFVFNRRILSDDTKEPQRIKLLPYEVSKPDMFNGEFYATTEGLVVIIFILSWVRYAIWHKLQRSNIITNTRI